MGAFLLPMLFSHLLDTYGFRGALPVIGACLLHLCVSASLYRPLAVHVAIQREQERREQRAEGSGEQGDSKGQDTEADREPDSVLLPAADCQPSARVDVGLSRASSIREGPRPPHHVGEFTPRSMREVEAPATPHSLEAGEASRFQFRCGSLESDLALGRRSIHSSYDSISMLSSVSTRSLEKLARPPEQEGGAPPRPVPHSHCQGAQHWEERASPYSDTRHVAPTVAKALSLRELAFHQIGSHISLYRSLLVGEARVEQAGDGAVPGAGLPAIKRKREPSRTSLMFSCEDIFVDSTSVLKDARHPSHQHLASEGQPVTHRLVQLHRTQSSATPLEIARRKTSGRKRFYSETVAPRRGSGALSRNSSFCRRDKQTNLGDRVSLIGSSELVQEMQEVQEAGARRKFIMRPVVLEEEKRMEKDIEGVVEVKEKDGGMMAVLEKYINLHLVKNPVFLVLAGSVMLMAVGVPHCLFFLPTHVKLVGLPSSDASILLSVSAIFDLAGRITFGLLLDLDLVPKYMCYCGMMLLSGLSTILLASTSTFPGIATCMALYGVGTGGWFLMVPLLLAEHLGVENIGSSYGLVRLAQSFTNLCGPIVAGALFQSSGNLGASFTLMGVSMLLGGLLVLLLPLAISREKEKKDSK